MLNMLGNAWGFVGCLVRGGSEEVVIVSFETWELVSKFSGACMLLGSVVWKLLRLFCVWMIMWKWKNWPQSWLQSWPQNNIKIKIN